MIFIKEEMEQLINEVYFGKSPELIAMEQQLDKLRNKYMGNYLGCIKINHEEDLIKFNRMVEDFFGFGCFQLYIIPSTVPNAFTLPISMYIDTAFSHKKDIVLNGKTGYKFNKKYHYATMVNCYSGIFLNPNFSTDEVMAIILHEIGHNFESSISTQRCVLNNIYLSSYILRCIMHGCITNIFLTTNVFTNLDLLADKFARKHAKIISYLDDFIALIQGIMQSGFYEYNQILKLISFGIPYIPKVLNRQLNKLIGNPLNFLRYSGELTADNFPTMYGYGSSMISVVSKFSDENIDSSSLIMSTVNKIPLISTLIHLNSLPAEMLANLFDEHPYEVTRALDQLALLKNEVNKTELDPKMRKILLEDIKTCEKELYKLEDTSKGIKDPYLFKKFYNSLLLKMNPDLKYMTLGNKKLRFDDYDKVYEKTNKQHESTLFDDIF